MNQGLRLPSAWFKAVDCTAAVDLQLWFTRVLRDAFAAQAGAVTQPFNNFAAYHLDVLMRKNGIKK